MESIKFNEPKYAEIAEKAYRVVTEDFADHVYGGYCMELTSSDAVANDIKHTYAQAFVLYPLCKYYEFNPKAEVFQKIKNFFALLEEPANDPSPYYRNDWKIDPWKCPCHNGRAMKEMIRRIDTLTKYD
ncbi:MAG: hypothetical protein AB2L20_31675 [Mangrovibacterium sp.]